MPNAAKIFRPYGAPAGRRADRRPSAAKRGYDEKWRRLRLKYLKEHPHCEHCAKRKRRTRSTEVDHKIPFRGLDDPLRLAWKNLQALCHSCHVKKTYQDKRSGK